MVFDKRNMDFQLAWRLSIICSKAIWLSFLFLDTIFYASYLNTYFARQSTEVCLGEVQIKHLTFSFRNHLYLSPRGHQVKGWVNYQVALIWSYETGKRIIVSANLSHIMRIFYFRLIITVEYIGNRLPFSPLVLHIFSWQPVTLELGEEVVFEYVDIGKRYMPHAETYIRCVRQRLNAL